MNVIFSWSMVTLLSNLKKVAKMSIYASVLVKVLNKELKIGLLRKINRIKLIFQAIKWTHHSHLSILNTGNKNYQAPTNNNQWSQCSSKGNHLSHQLNKFSMALFQQLLITNRSRKSKSLFTQQLNLPKYFKTERFK